MAGDWIKMRSDLFTLPKFMRLAAVLWSAPDRSQGEYVAGGESAQDVTERASHDVTFAALFRVWCAVNAHSKTRHLDAVCQGMHLLDLDVIAGYHGFGDAMGAAGLVEEDGPNCLVFPNFLEHNEPVCLRLPPRPGWQRMAESRARKKAGNPLRGVTNGDALLREVTPRDDTEEEEKEKSKEDNTPLTPQGGTPGVSPAGRRSRTRATCDCHADPRFARFWDAYPRREAKAAAAKAFAKLDPPEALLDAILAAVERQKRRGCLEPRAGADGRSVIPHASTWLNQRRWEDEPPPAAAPHATRAAARDEARWESIKARYADLPNGS